MRMKCRNRRLLPLNPTSTSRRSCAGERETQKLPGNKSLDDFDLEDKAAEAFEDFLEDLVDEASSNGRTLDFDSKNGSSTLSASTTRNIINDI